MTERNKPVEQVSADAAETPELKGGQRFLEGLIAVYEPGWSSSATDGTEHA